MAAWTLAFLPVGPGAGCLPKATAAGFEVWTPSPDRVAPATTRPRPDRDHDTGVPGLCPDHARCRPGAAAAPFRGRARPTAAGRGRRHVRGGSRGAARARSDLAHQPRREDGSFRQRSSSSGPLLCRRAPCTGRRRPAKRISDTGLPVRPCRMTRSCATSCHSRTSRSIYATSVRAAPCGREEGLGRQRPAPIASRPSAKRPARAGRGCGPASGSVWPSGR